MGQTQAKVQRRWEGSRGSLYLKATINFLHIVNILEDLGTNAHWKLGSWRKLFFKMLYQKNLIAWLNKATRIWQISKWLRNTGESGERDRDGWGRGERRDRREIKREGEIDAGKRRRGQGSGKRWKRRQEERSCREKETDAMPSQNTEMSHFVFKFLERGA